MQIEFFSHQAVSQRLSKKLQDWYSVNPVVTHSENTSTIKVNGLKFEVSRCKQFDKQNGQFTLTHKGKIIECTQMYIMVKQSK